MQSTEESISFRMKFNITLIPKNDTINSQKIKNYLSEFGKVSDIKITKFVNMYQIYIHYEDLIYLDLNENKYGKWSIKGLNTKNGKFLKIVNFKETSIIKIFNLCSSFGNIKEIYRKKNQTKEVILNFETFKGAIICQKYLSNLAFKEQKVKIFFHKYFIFNSKVFDKLEMKKKYQRFNGKKSYNINTPNNWVYFYNIENTLTHIKFYKLLKEKFNYFRFKQISNKKNLISYIVQFEKKDKAIESLMYFHNKKHKDFIIKASFTHSRF